MEGITIMNKPRRPTGIKKPKKELTKEAPKRGKYKVPREYNFNSMTEAAYKGMIHAALRDLSKRWKPMSEARKLARVSRGIYQCAACKECTSGKSGKVTNHAVDHKLTVVPLTGFVSWDNTVSRLFVELHTGLLQLLCIDCHKIKTAEENRIRREFKKGAIDLDPSKEYYVDIEVNNEDKKATLREI